MINTTQTAKRIKHTPFTTHSGTFDAFLGKRIIVAVDLFFHCFRNLQAGLDVTEAPPMWSR